MADIINLKRARKQKDKIKKAKQATVNAAKFGRSKAQKQIEEAEQSRLKKHLDGTRIAEGDETEDATP